MSIFFDLWYAVIIEPNNLLKKRSDNLQYSAELRSGKRLSCKVEVKATLTRTCVLQSQGWLLLDLKLTIGWAIRNDLRIKHIGRLSQTTSTSQTTGFWLWGGMGTDTPLYWGIKVSLRENIDFWKTSWLRSWSPGICDSETCLIRQPICMRISCRVCSGFWMATVASFSVPEIPAIVAVCCDDLFWSATWRYIRQ